MSKANKNNFLNDESLEKASGGAVKWKRRNDEYVIGSFDDEGKWHEVARTKNKKFAQHLSDFVDRASSDHLFDGKLD